MDTSLITVTKSSGKKMPFLEEKLIRSLKRSGASKSQIKTIVTCIKKELYKGISTKQIYNRAFALLKQQQPVCASKYKLKKAIYELGPTGFPFERFVGAIYSYSGYEIKIGQIIQGKCVSHEVDVIATKNNKTMVIECKFHSDQGRNCNVKIPLYIHSRYSDIIDCEKNKYLLPSEGWVITNTRFTTDAITYGNCSGLHLLSWSYPEGNSLKDLIDRLGLYPITVLSLLSNKEKVFLLEQDVVLCRQLLKEVFLLDHLGILESRKKRIINELQLLCKIRT